MTSSLESIRYNDGQLSIIDQLQLPHITSFIPIHSAENGWDVIRAMHVRGAPAIAIVAMLSLAVELNGLLSQHKFPDSRHDAKAFIEHKLDYLLTSRPTAVNLKDSAQKMKSMLDDLIVSETCSGSEIATAFIQHAEQMLINDVMDNRKIGDHGAKWIIENSLQRSHGPGEKIRILTHCNTGSLATAGYGTALGIIRRVHDLNLLCHAYCTETRPYNQGARLTAYEFVNDQIPSTLITDSMAGYLLKTAGIAAVVVGADRVAANGDTANKIGTYSLAVLAKYHGVKFVVAAPRTTIDMSTKTGDDIIIEQRSHHEVTRLRGPRDEPGIPTLETIKIAADGIDVWNPAFDVTPGTLIDAIVTELGVKIKDSLGNFNLKELFQAEVTS